MVQETWVQSQVASYQRLKKWFLIPPCLTLSNIRYVSSVKWSNLGKGVAPSPTSRCSSYRKGSPLVTLDYGRQLTYIRDWFIGLIWNCMDSLFCIYFIYSSTQAGCDTRSILSRLYLVWIQSFLSPRLVAILRLKSSVCLTIYP